MSEIDGGIEGMDEAALSLLSETLGVEIYMVGVGERHSLIPRQISSQASVATARGALAGWVVAVAENPDDEPWWKHTHPGMKAFFSSTDVEGAHDLYEAIQKPLRAVVLGKDGDRFEVVIDEKWIKSHPKPTFERWSALTKWSYKNTLQTDIWTPGGFESQHTRSSLREDLELILAEHGWKKILKTLQKMARGVRDNERVTSAISPYSLNQCPHCLKDPRPSKYYNVCGKCGKFLPGGR